MPPGVHRNPCRNGWRRSGSPIGRRGPRRCRGCVSPSAAVGRHRSSPSTSDPRVLQWPAQPSQGTMASALSRHDPGYFSHRSGTLLIVLSLHALLFYGLITTVSHIHVSAVNPLQNQQLKEPLPERLPIPVPQPRLSDVTLEIPPLDPKILREPDPPIESKTIPDPRPPSIPPSPPQAVKQVLGGRGRVPQSRRFLPLAGEALG